MTYNFWNSAVASIDIRSTDIFISNLAYTDIFAYHFFHLQPTALKLQIFHPSKKYQSAKYLILKSICLKIFIMCLKPYRYISRARVPYDNNHQGHFVWPGDISVSFRKFLTGRTNNNALCSNSPRRKTSKGLFDFVPGIYICDAAYRVTSFAL